MNELQPDRRELHLTVTSDTVIGFDEMLELALKELRRYTKAAAVAGEINSGETKGTVGSYAFEIYRGNPDLCMLVRSLENDEFERIEEFNPNAYKFEHPDGRLKYIDTQDLTIKDVPPIGAPRPIPPDNFE
jgi:hypothetical protein